MGEGEILKSINIGGRVNQPVFKHLSIQGRLDPRGGFHCFWCPNKTWTLPIGTFGTLKIIKNGIELKKLWPPKIVGVQELKKTNHQTLQGSFPITQ